MILWMFSKRDHNVGPYISIFRTREYGTHDKLNRLNHICKIQGAMVPHSFVRLGSEEVVKMIPIKAKKALST